MFFRLLIISIPVLLLAGAAQADFAERLAKSKAFQQQGQYQIALDEAKKARQEAENDLEIARADGAVGNLLLILKFYDQAEKALLSAIEHGKDIPQEKAGYANNLGILYSTLERNRDTCSAACDENELNQLYSEKDRALQAENYFSQALELVGDNQPLRLNIKLNRMHNKPELADRATLETLLAEIAQLTSPSEKIRDTLSLAAVAENAADPACRDLALKALEQAKNGNLGLNDSRIMVELLASLADKYEKRGFEYKALRLSEEATDLPGAEENHDLLIELEWRKGRIYQKQGRDEPSLAAYGKAVDHVQAIRVDIPVEYHEGHSSFRETLEPIYLGYAYQLLKKAGHQDGELKQKTLLLARQTVELIKQTEMEDFLGGRCLIEGIRRSELDNRDEAAASIYPIILPDRLELLVSFGSSIHQYTVAVSDKELKASAAGFAEKLRNMSKRYENDSKKLYQWLIAPLEQDLEAAHIKTLVIVPDGVLRLVPFSALNNGRHYLLEKFAVAVSPGMSLMGVGNAEQRTYNSLLVGVSRPGDVVEKLPSRVIAGILNPGQEQSASQRGLVSGVTRGVPSASATRQAENRDVEVMMRAPGALDKLKEELSLPGVEDELKTVNQYVKNTTLLNDAFTVKGFQTEMSNQPYDVVHIASHGIFTSDADTSFIMAHDNVLKINDLQNLLKGDKSGKYIDLLTLSACETAEGDDRAPMGFTGVALKANARSAIGALWPISDAAASQLMGGFYKNLTKLHNKAEALRQSQLELLKNPEMSHPFFWSPFILVGNWI